MYLIIGLGNPGREYERTRHNMGFLTLDLLAQKFNIDISKNFKRALVGEGRFNNAKVVLAKPQTYMNLSGQSVFELVNWYKCEPQEIIVIYDDVDLPLGSIRIRERGSSGSHNGMRSIIYQLGYNDFLRIRVGIGKPNGERNMVSHVLGKPDIDEFEVLIDSIKSAANATEMIVLGEINKAQELYNKKPKKPTDNEEQEVAANSDTKQL